MKNRAQLLVLATAASICLTACAQKGSLFSLLPAQDRQDALPTEELAISFDDTLTAAINLESPAENHIWVRSQTNILIDNCAPSSEVLEALVASLREAEPIAIAYALKAAERGYTIEWQHGDALVTIGAAVVGGEKYTAVSIDNQPFMADYTLYTTWIESFASVK